MKELTEVRSTSRVGSKVVEYMDHLEIKDGTDDSLSQVWTHDENDWKC
jgi:hypothetical protein